MDSAHHDPITLTRFILDGEHKHADAKGDLTLLMNAIQTACKVIASAVRKAGIAGLYGMEVTLAALSILLC